MRLSCCFSGIGVVIARDDSEVMTKERMSPSQGMGEVAVYRLQGVKMGGIAVSIERIGRGGAGRGNLYRRCRIVRGFQEGNDLELPVLWTLSVDTAVALSGAAST